MSSETTPTSTPRPDPEAHAVYGRVTGSLRDVVWQEDEETVEPLRQSYDVVPLYTLPAAATRLATDPDVVERMARVLEVHQVEWIDSEVGYACGCDEDGVLDPMFTLHDANSHQARVALAALTVEDPR